MIVRLSKLTRFGILLSTLIFTGCGDSSSSGSHEREINATSPIDDAAQDDDALASKYAAENEPYYKYLWHLDSKNSVLNSNGYDIDENAGVNINAAWEISKGANVKVAVIDDGADLNHEDLKANVASAYNADDDNADVATDYVNTRAASHGTSCAGFVAAPINGIGVTGSAPESKIVVIKNVSWADEAVIRAFNHAKVSGAKVVSCSWGDPDYAAPSQAVLDVIKDLYDSGITILFAAGNEGVDLDADSSWQDYSEIEWVIGVGGSNESNDYVHYSNYGKNVDVIAPAGDVYSSIGVLGLDNVSTQGSQNQQGLVNDNYAFIQGTSFACPIAAGVVSLMYSVNPNITPSQVREILINTADKVGVGATYDENGFDTQKKRAHGKINAGKAVSEAKNLTKSNT